MVLVFIDITMRTQATTGLADTGLAVTTGLANKLSEKTTILWGN